MAECKRRGWIAQVVEYRVPRVNILRDLFGVLDVVAITRHDEKPGGLCCVYKRPYSAEWIWTCPSCGVESGRVPGSSKIVGIQCCAGASHSARRAKILAEPRAAAWVEAGGRLELWSWAKQGARGKRKTWTLRVETYQEMQMRSLVEDADKIAAKPGDTLWTGSLKL